MSGRLALTAGTVSVLAVGLIGGGIADAHHLARGANTAKIKMVLKRKDLSFRGPKTVRQGQELQIVNNTSPRKVGPHTFSLVQKRLLPSIRKNELKTGTNCFTRGVCGEIAFSHEYDPSTNRVGKPVVEVGTRGWDRHFVLNKRFGDSWYTDEKHTRNTRKVSAQPGTTLFYICAVHPWMQGKIKVVK